MDGTTIIPATTYRSEVENLPVTIYERHMTTFVVLTIVYLCIAVLAVIGNSLVLYSAYGNKNRGRLRYLDDVVKSLAVADMLFGLVGVPCRIYGDYLG